MRVAGNKRVLGIGFAVAAWGLVFGAAANANDSATEFLTQTEDVLQRLGHEWNLAAWKAETEINEKNTEQQTVAAQAYDEEVSRRAKLAHSLQTSDPVALRKLLLLRLTSAGIIDDPALNSRLRQVVAQMSNHYSEACPVIDPNSSCLVLEKIEDQLTRDRNPERLKQLWTAWYDSAKPVGKLYPEYVDLANRGARDSGYPDAAFMSRALYEVDPKAFLEDLEALWLEVRPLYLLLHAYVRDKLFARYGAAHVDPKGPIPIHLLGNMWGQEWEGIFDLVAAPGPSPNADDLMRRSKMTPRDFVTSAERFFVSLGFPSLPPSFWERSFFERPRDNFNCHASAWAIARDDWRLKMCIEINWANFITVHHELGHIFYFQSFAQQPYLFRDAPNQGINEAIGDAAALSVTPSYLQRIGLLDQVGEEDINQLLRVALRKLARVPFGLMLQKWRWGVMAGEIPPERYNDAWWALAREYQGVRPPEPRPSEAFDPGAKQHIAADIDYIRYFLADVLTFQIHDALTKEASCAGPLHRCSVYQSPAAGQRWRAALALGSSRSWSDVLEAMTGERRVTGKPMRKYFAPLETWLKNEAAQLPIGWQ